MGNIESILKAIADRTRLQIVVLLLKQNYCVGALARKLNLTEAAISQHLKVLREVGLVRGEKRGYFVHYTVEREQLRLLAKEIEELAAIEREACKPERLICSHEKHIHCHVRKMERKQLYAEGSVSKKAASNEANGFSSTGGDETER
jgi:ArsR family transcriptional regulator